MVFHALENEAQELRQLFNDRYQNLPRIQFQEKWMDTKGRPIYAVMDNSLDTPVSTTSPDGRRVVIIPVAGLAPVVFFDKWHDRGDTSPLEFAYPRDFDMVDAPFELLRRSLASVLAQWLHIRNAGHVHTSDIIMPSIKQVLIEGGQGGGKLIGQPALIIPATA